MGELDVKAQRRRAAAQAIRAHLNEDLVPPDDLGELAELLAGLSGLPRRLFTILQEVDKGGDRERAANRELVAIAKDLRQREARAAGVWLRPWRRHGRGALQCVTAVRESVDAFIEAFGASDLGAAQHAAQRGQGLLDKAGQLAGELGEELAFTHQVVDLGETDLLAACITRDLQRLEASSGGLESIMILDRIGRGRLSVLPNDGKPGLGLEVHLVLLAASVLLDPDRLTLVCEQAHQTLNQDRLRAMGESANWSDYQRAATTTLFDACRYLASMVSQPGLPPRIGVRAQLLFIQDVIEGPVRHLLATMLACGDPGEDAVAAYQEARGRTGTSVVAAARGRLPAVLTEAMLVPARHASAHRDYVVHPAGVTLQASRAASAHEASFEELADAVLGLLETALGLQLAIRTAGEGVGQTPDDSDLLEELDPDLVPTVLLAASGWREVKIARDGDTMTVRGEVDLPTPMATIGLLLAHLDPAIHQVKLVAEQHRTTRTFQAATAPFREFLQRPHPADDFETSLLLLNALLHVTAEGRPIIERRHRLRIAAHFFAVGTNGNLSVFTSRCRRLGDWARDHQDSELETAPRVAQRAVVAAQSGLPVTPAEQAALALMDRWRHEPVKLPDRW
ncbi:hypothetical protein [Blastococcus sp. SYSU DS0619]